MVLFITEQDVKELENFASLTAAMKLRIVDPEFMTTDERITKIRMQNQEFSKFLDSFLEAYWKWFNFHKKIDSENKQGKLNGEETVELGKLIDARDKTRNEFLKAMAKIK